MLSNNDVINVLNISHVRNHGKKFPKCNQTSFSVSSIGIVMTMFTNVLGLRDLLIHLLYSDVWK